ncbi:hypothetical protein BZA05DRAFT_422498 [Tricharina praecox]|uniref:uncharacterized protein n=1 Tax=Tricharina praecox TaxID=43433 RepID=UPI002220B141|nr:uncharacterized protein BZA05DRAFT_422498 [Tricharina praecox]KAI5842347.1 hypothetical protein BZA05DRAFT_422498 [Tricharina praecox]
MPDTSRRVTPATRPTIPELLAQSRHLSAASIRTITKVTSGKRLNPFGEENTDGGPAARKLRTTRRSGSVQAQAVDRASNGKRYRDATAPDLVRERSSALNRLPTSGRDGESARQSPLKRPADDDLMFPSAKRLTFPFPRLVPSFPRRSLYGPFGPRVHCSWGPPNAPKKEEDLEEAYLVALALEANPLAEAEGRSALDGGMETSTTEAEELDLDGNPSISVSIVGIPSAPSSSGQGPRRAAISSRVGRRFAPYRLRRDRVHGREVEHAEMKENDLLAAHDRALTLERQLQREIVVVTFADEDEIWEQPGVRQAAEEPEDESLVNAQGVAEAQQRRDLEEGVVVEEAPEICVDNQGTIQLAKNRNPYDGTRPIGE